MSEVGGPLRIVHAAENIKGGVGSYLRELLVMQRQAFGADMVSAVVPGSQIDMLQAPAGVRIISFDDSGTRAANALRMARLARRVVSETVPDVVHLHSTFAGAVLRPQLTIRRRRMAVIYCPHGWAFDRDGSPWSKRSARWVERGLATLCDSIVCISEHERQMAVDSGIPGHKLTVVNNGVPFAAAGPTSEPVAVEWPEQVRRVLFVGRFDRQKGIDVLLDALRDLDGEAFAYLVGDPVLKDLTLERLPRNARHVGWLTPAQMEPYYRSADVLVIPSRWEGFGLTAVEAMRAGLAVIASRVGGLKEVVEDEITGILVPPGDAAALVDGLRRLTVTQLRLMGLAGKERFLRRFTLEQMHIKLLGVYRRSCDAQA